MLKVEQGTETQTVKAREVVMHDNRIDQGVPIWAISVIALLFGLIIPSPFKWAGFKR